MNQWDQIKKHVATRVSRESYQNWFSGSTLHHADPSTLRVIVPDENAKTWLEQEYQELVISVMRDLKFPQRRIVYEVLPVPQHNPKALPMLVERNVAELKFQSAETQLNPKFTFDSFVVGSCNQFAHAAAKAVATMPSRSYNPLFIYGGVGMGKTHLMHAVGRALLTGSGGLRIVYTSTERFMNELIQSIQHQRMPHFHQHYRNADVLLMDDIQILGGKERTQEEFFHTFNELYDHQKQIVLSSDSPPKEIPGLVERLRSRFEWGLMVDMQPPDLETKMAILDKKADAEGIKLPEDVRIFIATKTKSNIRELEGALVKLIAYSSVTETPISITMARHCLKHLVVGAEKRVTIDSVQKAVAERFSLQPSELKQKSNAQRVAYPRQVAMYLVKELTGSSLPEIGRAFGGKHHTTVLHSIQKIERLRHKDVTLNRFLHSLTDSFN
jgi:chromosomal replication initiator protein